MIRCVLDSQNIYTDRLVYEVIRNSRQMQGIDALTDEAVARIHQDYVTARREWIALIREDAENEYTLGDIDRDVLDDFVTLLDREVDFENQKLYM